MPIAKQGQRLKIDHPAFRDGPQAMTVEEKSDGEHGQWVCSRCGWLQNNFQAQGCRDRRGHVVAWFNADKMRPEVP